jgi:RND family efflux transporter MFP subunit
MTHSDPELLLAEACNWTTPEEHAIVSGHLEECSDCLDRFAQCCAECTILEESTKPGRLRVRAARLLIGAALLLFALTAGVIMWRGTRPAGPTPEAIAAPASGPPRVLPPSAQEKKEKQDKKEEVPTCLGRLAPSREVALYSKVQAYVERVEVIRGARVKKGDLLVQLRAPELQSLCEEARVRLEQDEAEVRRLKPRVDAAVVSVQELANAQSKVAIDRARLDTCLANVSYLKIIAPFDGTIAERAVEEGSLVGPPLGPAQPPLFKLQDIDRLHLVFSLFPSSEPSLANVKRGDRVTFSIDRESLDRSWSATFLGSTRTVDPDTGMFSVDLEVDNSSHRLLPGMPVLVSWPPQK